MGEDDNTFHSFGTIVLLKLYVFFFFFCKLFLYFVDRARANLVDMSFLLWDIFLYRFYSLGC